MKTKALSSQRQRYVWYWLEELLINSCLNCLWSVVNRWWQGAYSLYCQSCGYLLGCAQWFLVLENIFEKAILEGFHLIYGNKNVVELMRGAAVLLFSSVVCDLTWSLCRSPTDFWSHVPCVFDFQGFGGAVHFVDLPGHPRLKHKVDNYIRAAAGIVFVLDATDFLPHTKDIAEWVITLQVNLNVPKNWAASNLL